MKQVCQVCNNYCELEEGQAGSTEEQKETFVGDINAEIQSIVDNYVAEAKQKFAEYKDAFFCYRRN